MSLPSSSKKMWSRLYIRLLTPLYEAFDFYTLSRTLVDEELGSLKENRF